ncbi:MAG: lipase secretion chaperone [Burkholderiales bacterium]|nr:lipase secretion chaperone [Burkholderiales bacterium]
MKARSLRLRLGLAALAGVLASAIVGWRQSAPPTDTTQSSAGGVAPGAAFVKSMDGTVPDGNLRAWQSSRGAPAGGALALAELKRMFDYYLSAVGEQTVAAITQKIHLELERTLPADQVPQAKRLFGLYVEFKTALIELERKPGLSGQGVQAIRNRFVAMQDLRARFFNAEETQAMFGFEDAYDTDALARLEISQNSALSATQRQEQLAALDAAMPEDLRRERDAPRVILRVEEKVADMRAKGASDDDIYRVRAKEFSPEAAARLADLDREEAEWKRRIANYLGERSQLLQAQANAPEADRHMALMKLQQAQFSEDERRRLPAYEP